MSVYAKGDRVRFLGFGEPDPYSRLRVGTEGTVATVDDLGTVHVDWDDGQQARHGRRGTGRQATGSNRAHSALIAGLRSAARGSGARLDRLAYRRSH